MACRKCRDGRRRGTDCRRGVEWIESQHEPSWFFKNVWCWYFVKSIRSLLVCFKYQCFVLFCGSGEPDSQYVVSLWIFLFTILTSTLVQFASVTKVFMHGFMPLSTISRGRIPVAFVETPRLVSFLVWSRICLIFVQRNCFQNKPPFDWLLTLRCIIIVLRFWRSTVLGNTLHETTSDGWCTDFRLVVLPFLLFLLCVS